MAKLSLTDLASLANETSAMAAINANSALIETALENTLSRDGTSPNTMSAALDMNSNKITNLAAPTNANDAARKADVDAAIISGGVGGGGGDMLASNNLSELTDFATARDNLGVEIGVDVQAYDAGLADIAALAVTDSNFIVGNGTNWVAETGATVRTSLGLGTTNSPEFTAVNLGSATATTLTGAAGVLSVEGNEVLTTLTGQPLDSDLTAIAALTTTAAGRTGLTLADPGADQLLMWDEGTNSIASAVLAKVATEAAPAAGDFLFVQLAEDNLVKVNWSSLPGAGAGISNIVEDATPQLGGTLDCNTFNIEFDDNTGISDDSQNEQLWFQKTASAVNYWEMTNSAANGVQILAAVGGDTDISAQISSKGADPVILAPAGTARVQALAASFSPSVNDANALGIATTNMWSDLYLASGAVINFNAGDVTLTHTANTLTITGGITALDASSTAGGSIIATAASEANTKISAIEFIIDGGGAGISTGLKGFLEVPFACTINAVTMLADQTGSIVVDVWKDTYANYPPTDADSITAAAVPTITSATKSQDATLTGWTTAVSAGDILGFNVDSAATVQRVTISLKVTKT